MGPSIKYVRVRIRGLEMLVFHKILRTYLMDHPYANGRWNLLNSINVIDNRVMNQEDSYAIQTLSFLRTLPFWCNLHDSFKCSYRISFVWKRIWQPNPIHEKQIKFHMDKLWSSTHFSPVFHFYTPWNCQKTKDFFDAFRG